MCDLFAGCLTFGSNTTVGQAPTGENRVQSARVKDPWTQLPGTTGTS